ncbi:MAG TPA: hypothetical protein VFS77_22185, partial [Pyrinomonadaceae bacterium]|nr:hypothetical protein [Pyrinomonadaceae bacterium]
AREAPLGEEYEMYEVDVIGPGSPTEVINTLTATDEGIVYLASEQTTDGLTPGDPVTVRVYQISSTIGRGYVLEGTI